MGFRTNAGRGSNGHGVALFSGSGSVTTPANQPPATPTISAGSLTSSGATLTGSAFSDPDVGDTHAASQWQVTTSADTGYAAPVISTGDDATNKTSLAVTGLSASTAYIARVRYKDSAGNYSEWATSASFTTAAALVTRTDNFNRVDSTAGFGSPSDGGSAYTQRAGHGGISSNQGVPVASDSTGAGVAFNTNFTVCCETLACSLNGTFDLVLATRDAAIVQGIAFRCSDNSNFWVAAVRANLVYVYKVAGGVLTKLFDGVGSSNTLADGMTLRVVMTATGFEVWTVVGASSVKEYTSVDTFNSTGSAVHCGPFFGGDTTPRVDSLSFVGA